MYFSGNNIIVTNFTKIIAITLIVSIVVYINSFKTALINEKVASNEGMTKDSVRDNLLIQKNIEDGKSVLRTNRPNNKNLSFIKKHKVHIVGKANVKAVKKDIVKTKRQDLQAKIERENLK